MSKKHGRENDSVDVLPESVKSDVAKREEDIQHFWAEHDIFNKTLTTPAGAPPVGDYVFYDGPPFATGLPHYGHLLAGTIKDAVPRYWTMRGYHVRRKWGWDCHGLPLENLIEKELGLGNKRDIEEFGIQNFNEKARGAVMRYADEWARIIPRFGRFVDMEDDYKTMDSSYTESVWWVFAELNRKGLVYEGFKSMHLCPRCGTTLSNFEVNLGYKDIKDIAVTVKLPLLDEAGEVTDSSLLVWTTTPWTLPGNMAAAVHQEFTYVTVEAQTESGPEKYILAKERLAQLGDIEYQVLEECLGADLVGRRYQPPFSYWLDQDFANKENAWQIYHAEYVELGDDGTGAVHLAPAYGEEDMDLAKANNIPIVHHVDEAGRFKDMVKDFAGQLVKPKDDDSGVTHLDADIEIVKKLKADNRLVKKENITHSYPHCWRCDTPLLNYGTTSWFVKVTDIKQDLLMENNQVHWVPEHVGKNRFGKWLEGARDWAVSRQRYWGAPLPIWRNPETGEYKVFGSLTELQAYVPKSGNTYLVMRHAEAESNKTGTINALPNEANALTQKGLEQCVTAAADLQSKNIDIIIHSGLTRTKQTAECVAAELGIPVEQIMVDERLLELQAGAELEGQSWEKYQELFTSEAASFNEVVPGVENRRDVIRRSGELLYELERTYQDKNILLVGHASSVFGIEMAAAGADDEQALVARRAGWFKNTEVRHVSFVPLPHNDDYVLDYHRPYIDQIELRDTDGTKLERVVDVFDCWFESGSMPYGGSHYPFANTDIFDPTEGKRFPANFISESVDQTRGWFYSMMVLGVALFGKAPFKNVITNGLVLAEDGKKMSKSLQNYPDPVELADRVGVDAIRFYLLSSPIIRGEDLNFSEKEVLELQRKNIGRLHNVLAMYELYASDNEVHANSEQVLDRWIIARLNQLIAETTAGFERYELDRATRPLTDFVDDLSVWYVRRSRDRFKSAVAEDQAAALSTLRYVLQKTALIMAPAMPFYAEYLWQAVKASDDAKSVHLAAWPNSGEVDNQVLANMQTTRAVVSSALEARTKLGIKVRQPLSVLRVAEDERVPEDYIEIIADEVNVKELTFDASLNGKESHWVELDTTITPELRAEGQVRELIRAIQQARKERQLQPQQKITLQVNTAMASLLEPFIEEVKKVAGISSLTTIADEDALTGQLVLDSVTYRYDIIVL